MQLKAIHSRFTKELGQVYDQHEAAVITDMVFEEIARAGKAVLITQGHLVLTVEQLQGLEDALVRLKKNEPVQYVLGKAWFYKMFYYVSPAVLIPRPETEELVEAVLTFIHSEKKHSVLDIGTGSGCIAISIKKNAPSTSVRAIDVSADALQIAKKNADTHDVRILFHELNFLAEEAWAGLTAFDVIVSNPPYIPINEKDKLDKNVTQFEPSTALFVPQDDPLIFYRKISAFAKLKLAPRGKVFMEVHEDYAQQVLSLFTSNNYSAAVLKDFYGKERMVTATHCQ